MNVEYFKADLKNLVPCALFKRISVEGHRSGPTRPKDPGTCEENLLCDWEGDIFNAEPRKERRGWGSLYWEQQVCRLGSHTCSRWPLNPTWDKFFRLPQMPRATGWCQYFCWDSESRGRAGETALCFSLLTARRTQALLVDSKYWLLASRSTHVSLPFLLLPSFLSNFLLILCGFHITHPNSTLYLVPSLPPSAIAKPSLQKK